MQKRLEIAHLNLEDVKVIIVFVECAPTQAEYESLQRAAAQTGLGGSVVAVWPDECSRTRFLAPPEQHAFFRIVDYAQLRAQINGSMLF